jgi:hypothetical protein
MGHVLKILAVQIALAAVTLSFMPTADAGYCKGRHCKVKRHYDEPGVYRYVTAEKTTGTQTVTAPVRPGRWGDEVRLPGGTWIDCGRSCENTLRHETVDFWDDMTNKTNSPGYFRFEFDLDTGAVYRKRYQ